MIKATMNRRQRVDPLEHRLELGGDSLVAMLLAWRRSNDPIVVRLFLTR
jgi:hypothetical protein